MAQGKNYKDLSNEKLKKLLLTYNIISVLGGVGALTAIFFYFLNRVNKEESDYTLLIVGMALGAAISSVSTVANKIKKEIKDRDGKI